MSDIAMPCHFCKALPVVNSRERGDVVRCNFCWMQSPMGATPDEAISIWNIIQSNFNQLEEISNAT